MATAWQQHHPSPQLLHEFLHQLWSSASLNLFTSIYFTGIIFLNYFLKAINSQHSIFMFFRTVFKLVNQQVLTAKTHYLENTTPTLQSSCKHLCIKPQQALDQEIQHLQWLDFTSLLLYKNIKNPKTLELKRAGNGINKQGVKPCYPSRHAKLASENVRFEK